MSIIKKQTAKGFTIIEVVSVITIIGIVASIVTVSYNGYQARATNASKFAELKAWEELFQIYWAKNGQLPNVADAGYCLGTGFPSGKCRDYTPAGGVNTYLESDSTGLMKELATVSELPSTGPRVGVNGTIGPYVDYWADHVNLFMVIKGALSDCPAGTIQNWSDNNGRTLCMITVYKK